MAHLLATLVVKAVGQVHGMVKECRLGSGSREDGNLGSSVFASYEIDQAGPRTVSLSRSSIFILAESPVDIILVT